MMRIAESFCTAALGSGDGKGSVRIQGCKSPVPSPKTSSSWLFCAEHTAQAASPREPAPRRAERVPKGELLPLHPSGVSETEGGGCLWVGIL